MGISSDRFSIKRGDIFKVRRVTEETETKKNEDVRMALVATVRLLHFANKEMAYKLCIN